MIGMISLVNRRVSRSFSPSESLLGVADDAALGAAVGQIDQRVLPGLEHGQGHDLVHVHGRVVANAALERAAGVVVLGAIAGEDLDAVRRPS